MRKLRLFYQENKDKIWKAVGIIALILVCIQIINQTIKKQREEQQNKENDYYEEQTSNTTYLPSQSVISSSSVSEQDTETNTELIDQFINFCNESSIEEAYNLLSSDCKEILFPSIDDFYYNYWQDIFTQKKSYDLEVWGASGYVTYKIKIINDILSTGKVDEEYIEDYYTIIKENGEKKLNISHFIRKEEIGKEKEIEGITVCVNNRYIYSEYEEYTIKIENNTGNRVLIDTKENTDSVFLRDTNGIKHDWYGYEIANQILLLNTEESREFNIKFNKSYNPKIKAKSIEFTDIHIEGKEDIVEIEIGI